ncbi:MAG: peptidase M42 [Deltaproteobacteria bacterium CG_4_8_14_3_um_filter_45_9]|nr:MAG: peptidase M42 [Deltaproteobacteria bacterium CG03_land_8_20_14_0_80_45_14]PIX21611.1 MAG: peptidase M42 [Deltaproteobacteria bacterium CG_4_8_14_3_um_filter_45_9]
MLGLFKKLVEISGGSGFEEKVIEFIAAELKRSLQDVSVDPMGNVIGKTGKGKKSVMICAHSDEVGMLVKYIAPKGYIYFDLNGMIDERVLLSTRVDICSDKGIYTGVVGVKNRHLLTAEDLKRPISISDLWIDVGAEGAEEVRRWGIEIGDPIVFHPNFQKIGKDTILSKAIDNRAGCAILIDLAERMKSKKIDYQLFFVAATQEEVGSRGAKVAAQTLKPDMAIVIDTVPASDPITPPQQATSECGKGPVIRSMDVNALGWGTIYSKKIRERLIHTALKNRIPLQKDIFRTWTDASTIHTSGRGIPCGGLYIPRRYSHSPMELVKWSDVERTANLLYLFLKELRSADIDDLIRKV